MELADELTDTLMEDALPIRSSMRRVHEGPRTIKWTPINQPWRRNSHNAELFDSPVPEGSYLTMLMRHGTGVVPEEFEEGAAEAEAVDSEVEGEEEGEGADGGAAEEEPANEPTFDYKTLHTTCEQIFKDDPKLLINERLLTVAGLYTNSEILDKIREYHPDALLPLKNFTQKISDTITRVATHRGVAREVVKKEIDAVRERCGVFERQVAYNSSRKKEGKAARGMQRKTEVEGEGDAGTKENASGLNGVAVEQRETEKSAFPYGLGRGDDPKEPEVLDSDDNEEL